MMKFRATLNTVLAAFALFLAVAVPSLAQEGVEPDARVDGLFSRLQDPNLTDWQTIEEEIWLIWSRSGSATADYLMQRAHTAMDSGDYPGAIAHLTAAIDHAPDFTEAYNQRATVWFMMGRFGPSIADIQEVLAREPRHFGALSGLGQILREMGEDERALEAFREAAAIHPHRPDLQNAIEMLERELEGSTL